MLEVMAHTWLWAAYIMISAAIWWREALAEHVRAGWRGLIGRGAADPLGPALEVALSDLAQPETGLERAIRELTGAPGAEVGARLVELLQGRDPTVSRRAAWALLQRGEPATLPAVYRWMAGH